MDLSKLQEQAELRKNKEGLSFTRKRKTHGAIDHLLNNIQQEKNIRKDKIVHTEDPKCVHKNTTKTQQKRDQNVTKTRPKHDQNVTKTRPKRDQNVTKNITSKNPVQLKRDQGT